MDETPNLRLPYILPAQAQKHVTHNEAIRALDALVQSAVRDRDLAAPPVSPAEGDRYIVAASPSGAWSGQASKIAAWQDGAWTFYAPLEGWLAWVADEDQLVVWNGTGWVAAASGGGGGGANDHGALTGLADDDHLQYLTNARGDARYTPLNPLLLGVNATADTTNRLAVSSAATLFNHAGAGHQIKLNKNAATDTASFLFQTGFSGRAEIGTTGSDDFYFKVSPDGTTFQNAIVIAGASGLVTLKNNSVANAALADMAAMTLKGNDTGAAADPSDLSPSAVAVLLPAFTPDTGVAAGVKGLVPASVAGDAAAAKFLRADSTWAVPTSGGVAILASDVVNNNAVANTLQNVTGFTFSVAALKKYKFTCFIAYNAAATTTGSRWTVNLSAGTTANLRYFSRYTLTTTTFTANICAGVQQPTAANATSLTTGNIAIIEGFVDCTVAGAVHIQFASEIASSAITALGGLSYLEWKDLN